MTMPVDDSEQEQELVEEVWQRRLREAGLDETTAKAVTARLQSSQALTVGATDPETVLQQITHAIERLDLDAFDVPEAEQEAVKADLLEALEAAVDGRLDGPVALRTPGAKRTLQPTNESIDYDTDDSTRSERELVEEVWQRRLREAGLDPSTAKAVTARLQSSQALTVGSADPETVRQQITHAIERLDLDAFDVDDEISEIRSDLRAALEAALEGDLAGPIALRSPSNEPRYRPTNAAMGDATDDTGSEDPSEPGEPDQSVDSEARPDPRLGAANINFGAADHVADEADTSGQSDGIEAFAEEIGRIARSVGLTTGELQTAVTVVTGDRSVEELEEPLRSLAADLRQLVQESSVTERDLHAAVRSLENEDE